MQNYSNFDFSPEENLLTSQFHCPVCGREGSAGSSKIETDEVLESLLKHAFDRFRETTGCTHEILPGRLVRNSD